MIKRRASRPTATKTPARRLVFEDLCGFEVDEEVDEEVEEDEVELDVSVSDEGVVNELGGGPEPE
jgi:hypothetical protein